MRYSAAAPYTVQYPVAEFVSSDFQDPTSLAALSACSKIDEGLDSAVFVAAAWVTDATTDPTTYSVKITLGPGKDHVLTAGRWMVYLSIAGEVYEAGAIEVY